MKYAINYVLGGDTRVLVVDADDRDDAYADAREWLRQRRMISASLQGSCRVASQDDVDAFARWSDPQGSEDLREPRSVATKEQIRALNELASEALDRKPARKKRVRAAKETKP